MKKKPMDMTSYFQNEFVKEAAAQTAMPEQVQSAQLVQPMDTQIQDPNQMPLDQLGMPAGTTNNMGQAGLPTTAIVCNSDCEFAQNTKGMCSLNKINFEQIKGDSFQCPNYKPVMTEQLY